MCSSDLFAATEIRDLTFVPGADHDVTVEQSAALGVGHNDIGDAIALADHHQIASAQQADVGHPRIGHDNIARGAGQPDLRPLIEIDRQGRRGRRGGDQEAGEGADGEEIGRASCRERV